MELGLEDGLLMSKKLLMSMEEQLPYPEPSINIQKIEGLSEDFIRGVDISSIISLEQSGVKFYDVWGARADVFKVLAQAGVSHVRIRVWNNPYDNDGNGYGGGNCDLEKAIEMGKRATRNGLKVLIDFHYSDFWADPAKQKAPKAWQNYSVAQRADAIYNFTKDSLTQLVSAGVNVDMVQVGNETGYGFCGCATWDMGDDYTVVPFSDIARLMNAGSRAIREIDPNILVVVHNTEPNSGYQWISKDYHDNNVDYDVFASSYYPNIHGSIANLKSELKYVADTYGKKVMVAETQYPYTKDNGDDYANALSEKTGDMKYPISVQGQAQHVRDVCQAIHEIGDKGIGVFYWECAWIPVGTVWSDNEPIWGQYGSGWASKYASEYDHEIVGDYSYGSVVDNQAFFDFNGRPMDSINIFKYIYTGATVSTGGNGGGMTDGGCIGDITQITGWNAVQAEYEITEDALTVRSTGSYSMFYNNNIPTTGGSKFLIEGYITKGGTNTWISSYEPAYLRDNMIDDTHFSIELRANVANEKVNLQIQLRASESEDTEVVFTKIYLE